ncbi:MAG: hypothetical protein Q7J78_05415, partial [Clostridiales bacterium]|nr:hypothetical protein [Clostridiales bacterium]
MKRNNLLFAILRYFAYGIVIIITIYPLLFVIQTSFKLPVEFTENFWLPSLKGLTLDNYSEVWFNYKFYLFFRNSFIVSALATLLVVLFSLPGGYAFARLKFPFSEKVFMVIL